MDRLYRVEEIAEILRIATVTVRKYIYSGQLQATRIGRRVLVRESDLERFIMAQNPAKG